MADVSGTTINIGTGVRTTVAQILDVVKQHVPDIKVSVSDPTPRNLNGIYADTRRMQRLLKTDGLVGLAEGVRRSSDFVKTA